MLVQVQTTVLALNKHMFTNTHRTLLDWNWWSISIFKWVLKTHRVIHTIFWTGIQPTYMHKQHNRIGLYQWWATCDLWAMYGLPGFIVQLARQVQTNMGRMSMGFFHQKKSPVHPPLLCHCKHSNRDVLQWNQPYKTSLLLSQWWWAWEGGVGGILWMFQHWRMWGLQTFLSFLFWIGPHAPKGAQHWFICIT